MTTAVAVVILLFINLFHERFVGANAEFWYLDEVLSREVVSFDQQWTMILADCNVPADVCHFRYYS